MKITLKTPSGFEFTAETESNVSCEYALSAIYKMISVYCPQYIVKDNQ